MKDPNSKKWQVVTHPEATNILLDFRKARYLIPFMRQDLTLSKAAERLHLSPSTMHYHIQRFLRLELIHVVRSEQKRGRLSHYYRTRSEHFFVPASSDALEHILIKTHGEMFAYVRQHIQTTFRHQDKAGFGVWLDQDGLVSFAPMTQTYVLLESSERHPTSLLPQHLSLKLNQQHALDLKHRLEAILQEFREQKDSEGQKYILNLSFVPVDTDKRVR